MERLDFNDPLMEEKYSILRADAIIRASEDAEKMLSAIEYYQTHTYEEICEDARRKLREKMVTMDMETALRNATILAFKIKGETNVPEKEVKGVMDRLSPRIRSNIIGNYKKITYKEQLAKELKDAKESYDIYSKIKDNEKIEYASKVQDMFLSKYLVDARITAITEAADERGVERPACLGRPKLLHKETDRITNKMKTNEKEKGTVAKIRSTLKSLPKVFGNDEFSRDLAIAFASMAMAATCAWDMTQHIDIFPMEFLKLMPIGATAYAAAGAAYNIVNIKDFFQDRSIINEAKNLGLMNLYVNWGVASNEVHAMNERIMQRSERENTGGSNGLH